MPRPDLSEIHQRLARLRAGDSVNDEAVAERDRIIDELLDRLHGDPREPPAEVTGLPAVDVPNLLQAIIDAIPAAITVRDPQGRYCLVNAATPASAGLTVTPEFFLGRTFAQVQPLGAQSEHVKAFEQVMATGEAVRDRVYGSAVSPGRWREMTAAPLLGVDGQIAYVLTLGLDVTDRVRAQEALRESERRLSEFVRNLPGVAYRLRRLGAFEDDDAERRLEFVSEGCFELFGYTAEEIMNQRQSLMTLTHAEDRRLWREELSEAYRRGRTAEARVRARCADGSSRWVLQRSRVVEDSEEGQVVEGLIVDIDAQMRAEAALTARQELLQTLIDTIPAAGITMCDADGRFQFINRVSAGLIGPEATTEDYIGKTREELGERTSLRIAGLIHQEVVLNGEPIIAREYRSEAVPGEWRQLFAAPVRGADGAIDGVVQVHVDITRLKQVENDLQQHRDRLEELVAERTAALSQEVTERCRAEQALARNERLAAVGQVAATVSHELRNPLGTIKTSMFALTQSSEVRTPVFERARQRIERNIERCVQIIERMLDFTRMRPLEIENTNMERWCREVVADAAIPEGIDLILDLNCSSPVSLDPEQMRHALLNLLQNAYQAVGENPAGAPCTVTLSARNTDEGFELAVTDSGPGIEAENLEHIFEPLFSTRSFGVGLGLPLVKRLVEEHGGTLQVDSESGRGTDVRIHLPLRKDD